MKFAEKSSTHHPFNIDKASYEAGWRNGKRDAYLSYARQIKERDERIAEMQEELNRLNIIAYSEKGSITHTIHSPARFADAEKKEREKRKSK